MAGLTRLQVRREVAQEGSLMDELVARDFVAATPNIEDDFDHIFDVALRVDAARNGETDQIHGGVFAKHKGADFDGTNAALDIEFDREGDTGKLRDRKMREESTRVDVNGVAARRLNDRHAFGGNVVAEECGGGNAIFQVVLFEGFLEADGGGVEIASRQAAIGREAFGENEQVFFLLGEQIIIRAQEATDIDEAVFFGGHGAAVGMGEDFACDFEGSFVGVAGFAQFDEVGVFGETAGVDVQRNPVLFADLFYCADVGQRDGLATAGIVGDREHDEGNLFGAFAFDQFGEARGVHVAFERVEMSGLFGFRKREVDGGGAIKFAIGAGGIEVRVARDNVAFLAGNVEEDAFGGAPLVRGDDVAKTKNALHGFAETREAGRSGIGFIAAHHGSPLFGGHGGGAGVGQQIDEDGFGRNEKKIVAGIFDKFLALGASGGANGFDAFDTERLDDRADGHGEDTLPVNSSTANVDGFIGGLEAQIRRWALPQKERQLRL